MKRSRVSPEPNNSAPCRARFLRNKIFFFFFHLLLCCLLLTTFFFRLPKKFFFDIQPSLAVAVERNSLRSMCIHAEPFSGGNFCAKHNSPHTGIVIPLVTSKQRSKGARAWQQLLYTLFFLDFHGFEFNMTDYIMLHSLPCQWQRQIKMSHGTKCVAYFKKKSGQFHLTIEMYFQQAS